MKQHETHSRTGTIQVLLRACWQGFRTITMCRRRGVRPAAAGPGRSAGGQRQGQGGPRDRPLRAEGSRRGRRAGGPPPTSTRSGRNEHQQHCKRRQCGGCRWVRRARAGLEIDHSEPQARVWRSRGRPDPPAPGTSAAPQETPAIRPRTAQGRRPAPLDATTQTQLRSTCVRCRSARTARRSRRSSRSPRLRRRAGPRR